MKRFASLTIVALVAWASSAQAQRVRVVEEGPGTANATATLASLSAVIGELPRDASLEQILSRIQTDPTLSQDPDVIGFLASAGEGRLTLQNGNDQMGTLFRQLPRSRELVASLELLATGGSGRPATCNPLNTWLGTGTGLATPNQVSRRVQQQTLQKMLDAPGDVIELDLDMTTLMPVERILNALRTTGERYDIEEFKNPELLPMLPGYTGGGFNDFLARVRIDGQTLPEKYPDLDWRASDGSGRGPVYRTFRGAYWGGDLSSDQVVPGLADFIRRAQERGKMVIFVSGRSRGWARGSVEALKKGGVVVDHVFSSADEGEEAPFGSIVLLIGQLGGGDSGTKRTRQAQIRRFWGEPSSFVDDRGASIAAVEGASNAFGVHPRQLGFAAEAPPDATENAISTFEMDD